MAGTVADLSKGALREVFAGRKCDDTFQPVFQILDLRKVPPSGAVQADRYRLILSDGEYYTQGMLATGHNNLVTSGELAVYCLVKATNLIVNSAGGKQIIICLNLSVAFPPGAELGSPTKWPQSAGGGGAQQQQQPQRQSQQQQQSRFGNNQQQRAPFNQQGNSNFSGYNRPSSAGGINALNVVPVSSLNPYRKNWTIRARVTSKSDVRHWQNANGAGKLFSIDLLDKDGGEIRATLFKEQCDKFEDVLQENQVYLIKGGRVKTANKKFSALKHEYEITFDHSTQVELVNNDPTIKAQQYDFVSIADINNRNPQSHVDLMAVVKRVDQIATIMSQKTNKELTKRTILLADQTGAIELTLWSNVAEKYNEETLKGSPVVCIKSARVSDYGGRSLSMTGSTMEINPDMQGVVEMTQWWQEGGENAELQSLSASYSGGQSITAADKWLFIEQINSGGLGNAEKPDYFVCKGTISTIRSDISKPPYYLACTNDRNGRTCNKKVADGGNYCEMCGKATEARARYVLSFAVNDFTGSQFFSAFDDIGQKLLGCEAEQMRAFHDEGNEPAFGAVTQDALFQTKVFKCRAKVETYNDDNRLKCTVVTMKDLDYAEESAKLIEYLENMAPQQPAYPQGQASMNMVG